ncbi:MAG: PqqD family protein [Cyanobacteria bacterium J06600_6]
METSKEGDNHTFDLDQKFTVAEDILFRQVEEEGILLHISSGTYYNLNETSILFWEALTDSKPLSPVVEQITNEYEVEREYVLKDLQTFLQDLSQNQLIIPFTA